MSDDDDARVGYGRPPTRTRFQPGQSGNSKGRPKGSRSLSDLIARELNGATTVVEQGQRKKLKRREILAKRLVSDALTGKKTALSWVIASDREIQATLHAVANALTSEQDEATRLGLARRVRAMIDNESGRSEASSS